MLQKFLKSKIHRASVTGCDLDYEGSILVDSDLLAAAHIHSFESVQIWNVTNGERFETYAISLPPAAQAYAQRILALAPMREWHAEAEREAAMAGEAPPEKTP